MHFLLFSKETFENFLKNFTNNCVFRPKRVNLTQRLCNFFEKSPKIIHFLQFSEEIFWKFSKFSGFGGLCPRTPYEAHPLKCPSPRTEILAAPLAIMRVRLAEPYSKKKISKNLSEIWRRSIVNFFKKSQVSVHFSW